jgi:hypothetical protein
MAKNIINDPYYRAIAGAVLTILLDTIVALLESGQPFTFRTFMVALAGTIAGAMGPKAHTATVKTEITLPDEVVANDEPDKTT